MLQAVIHDNHIGRVAAAEQLLCGKAAIGVLRMWHLRHQQLEDLLFIVAAVCRSAIAATDDAGVSTQLLQLLAEQCDDRCFPGPAGGQIANADDRDSGVVNGQQLAVVERIANGCDQTIAAGGDGQHCTLSCRPQSAVCSADQSEKPGLIHGDSLTFERKQQSPGHGVNNASEELYPTTGRHSNGEVVSRKALE